MCIDEYLSVDIGERLCHIKIEGKILLPFFDNLVSNVGKARPRPWLRQPIRGKEIAT